MNEKDEWPKAGSRWRHYNGADYVVVCIANLPDTDRYPATIVYRGDNGMTWARRADDWHRSMTRIAEPRIVAQPSCPYCGDGSPEQSGDPLGGCNGKCKKDREDWFKGAVP